PLATSPALYPPIPSASTTKPFAGSEAIESSLCERTIPGSVALVISSTWERSINSLKVGCRRRLSRTRMRVVGRHQALQPRAARLQTLHLSGNDYPALCPL